MKSLVLFLLMVSSLSLSAAVTFGTYNIRNFDYDQRYRIRTNKTELNQIIKNLNSDVLAVQEINNTREFERFVSTQLQGYDTELTRCGGAHGQRLGFVFNKNKIELLSFNEDLSISNPGGMGTCDSGSRPMAVALFQIKATGQKFFGMSVHLKSGPHASSMQKRRMQYHVIKNTIQELTYKTGVKDYFVAGDFNTTDFVSRGPDSREFKNVFNSLGMVDLGANLECTSYWWGGTDDGIETPSLLDHVLVTKGLIKVAPRTQVSGHCQKVSCQEVPVRQLGIGYEFVSDHCPVTARIQ